MLAAKILKLEEGFRDKPYYCTEGFPTVGYGRVIGKSGDPLPDIIVTEPDERKLLIERIERTERAMASVLEGHNESRRAVLVSMAYQLGVYGVLQFKRFLAAMKDKNYDLAHDEMLDSKWARQTPARAKRHASVIESGDVSSAYDFKV